MPMFLARLDGKVGNQKEKIMDWNSSQGAPIVAAIIVLLAIVALSGISIGFAGNVQF
jgi:hypothetical protein